MAGARIVQRITQRRGVRQFVKFGIVGASGFLVNLAVFTLIFAMTPVSEHAHWYAAAYSIAFLSGGVSNYALNRIWTFRATGHYVVQGVQFLTISVVALFVGLGVSHVLQTYLHLPAGHRLWFAATVSGMLVNFFFNKYWTFRPQAE